MEKKREPEKAIEAMRRALELRPNSHRVLSEAGSVYQGLQQYDEALSYYERALELNPGSSGLLWQIAWLHVNRGDFRQTKHYMQRTIRSAPGHSYYYDYLRLAMVPLGEFEEYGKIIEEAAKKYGEEEPNFLALHGVHLRRTGEYEKSIALLRRALAAKDSDEIRWQIAASQWHAGDSNAALKILHEAIRHRNAPRAMLYILRAEQRYEEIEELIASVKKPGPQRYSGLDYWASLASGYYASMRRWDDAIAVTEEAKASGQMTWVEYEEQSQAEWYRMKGEIPQARALLDKCIESCPVESRIDAHYELALLEAAVGNLPAALEQVEQAASLYRWEDHHLALAAALLYATHRDEEALDKLRQIRGRYYTGERAVYYACQLRSTLEAKGGSSDCWAPNAERLAWRAREWFYYYLGRCSALRALCLVRTGDLEEARREIAWALKVEPEREDIAYLATAAYAQLGENDRALRWLRTAVDRGHQELWWARVDPDLDPLRGDPRFDRIMSDWEARLVALFGSAGYKNAGR
jgi:tetratricopeptide (TPR) repeat protein